MLETSVKEARSNFSSLLKQVELGNEVQILKHGKPIAKLVSVKKSSKKLPNLEDFRNSIQTDGAPLSQAVIESRDEERF